MDDEKIIELFLERNEKAIEFTARKYGAALRKIAFNVLNDNGDAEECENDTYLKAWNTIPPNEPRTYYFAFLTRITRLTAISRLRSRLAEKRNADFCELTAEAEACIPSGFNTETEAEARELGRKINAFLKTLPEQKRNIFIRRYYFFDSIKDISRLYSVSEGKVKSVLFRLRAELHRYLSKEDFDL